MTDTPKTQAGNWAEYPFQTIKGSARIVASSTSKVYQLIKCKELEAKRLNGRTVIVTESLKKLVDRAEPWEPALHRAEKANKVRLGKLVDRFCGTAHMRGIPVR
jgi:hypothetical protein